MKGELVLVLPLFVACSTLEGDQLFMQRAGRAREELIPIGNDWFVRVGAPRGERFFRRDQGGNVVSSSNRCDNNDLPWRRD
jgi:hypothetical protein